MKPGDQVRWVSKRRGGRFIRFTQRSGRLILVNGGECVVKSRNGREIVVKTSELEIDGPGPGQLTREVMATGDELKTLGKKS